MFSGRMLLVLATTLLMAIGAVLIAKRWVESTGATPAAPVPRTQTVKIVVAARDLSRWQTVEESHLKEIDWPKDAVTADILMDKAQVLGRLTIDAVYAGEPFNGRRVVDPKGADLFSLRIAENKRAFTVRVNDVSGLAGFLLPENHVDVLASRKLPGSNEESLTETLIQDIRVLGVDQESTDDKTRPVVVHSVTLEMTPEQAEAVFKADEEGAIQLALRNPTDTRQVKKADTNIHQAPSRSPSPIVSPPARKTYTIVRGSHSSLGNCGRFECSEQVR